MLVLAATATLVRAAPPATIDDGPVVRELDLGPMRLQMDIEPATVGPNDYHLYLFDRRTGAQIDRVEELTVKLVQRDKGIGPITLDIPRKGPAHYELRNSTLGVARHLGRDGHRARVGVRRVLRQDRVRGPALTLRPQPVVNGDKHQATHLARLLAQPRVGVAGRAAVVRPDPRGVLRGRRLRSSRGLSSATRGQGTALVAARAIWRLAMTRVT